MERINQNETCGCGKKVYTVKEISEMLGISLRSAYNLCGSDVFKVIRLGGKSIRIHKDSFDRWFSDTAGESKR